MEKSEDELIKAIFTSNLKPIIGERIQLSNECDLIIHQVPTVYKQFETEEEYLDYHDDRPAKAAKELFNQIHDQSCIAFWLELTKLIREHCIEEDKQNHEYFKKIGKATGDIPRKHFEAMFDKVCGKQIS